MALYSQLWPYIVMALYSYGHMYATVIFRARRMRLAIDWFSSAYSYGPI